MKTIDTRGPQPYNPLILVVEAICTAPQGEQLEILMDNHDIFNDLKEYLSQRHIGFREIYGGEHMALQFTCP